MNYVRWFRKRQNHCHQGKRRACLHVGCYPTKPGGGNFGVGKPCWNLNSRGKNPWLCQPYLTIPRATEQEPKPAKGTETAPAGKEGVQWNSLRGTSVPTFFKRGGDQRMFFVFSWSAALPDWFSCGQRQVWTLDVVLHCISFP